MKRSIYSLLIFLGFSVSFVQAQTLYFPPLTGSAWETTVPADLNWCTDKIDPLYNFLEEKNTKAFIVLKDGKIVLEKYFGSFIQDSIWYWASAGKTLTSMLTGIAQEEGFLSISDKSSDYLGEGWTSLTSVKEDLITIKNQLTMTSGLDDDVPDNHCYIDSCLIYKADAGTRWAYHNAPYTLLDRVIENATSKTFAGYFTTKIRSKIGMNGIWLKLDYDNVYFSTPRSMARYGLLVLNHGKWNTDPVLADTNYFNQMVSTSQNLNLSYGYLWWLNGKTSYRLPESQLVFPGFLMPNAPADMISALGKNGQIINVVPSQNLVLIRMGNVPGNNLGDITTFFNDDIWKLLNEVICNSTASNDESATDKLFIVYPNPVDNILTIQGNLTTNNFKLDIYNLLGQLILSSDKSEMDVSELIPGLYTVALTENNLKKARIFIKM